MFKQLIAILISCVFMIPLNITNTIDMVEASDRNSINVGKINTTAPLMDGSEIRKTNQFDDIYNNSFRDANITQKNIPRVKNIKLGRSPPA